jgi:hypothetical protein
MSNQIASEKRVIFTVLKRKIVILSALMLGCSLFSGPVQASGDERRERSEYEGRERYREESKLYGVIEKMPENGLNGTWIINGNKVLVSDRTRIKEKHGRVAVGRYVEAEGVRNGDNFTAYKIEVERSREFRSDDRRGSSKFYGTVEALPQAGMNGAWKIDGREVVVTRNTRIKEKYDKLKIGSSVEVEGVRNGDSFTAYEIEVERSRESRSDDRRSSTKFYGTVEALPQTGMNGVWKIDGREVVVTRNTRIKEEYGKLKIGSSVEVEGRLIDNTFTADEIEVKSGRR